MHTYLNKKKIKMKIKQMYITFESLKIINKLIKINIFKLLNNFKD